MKILKIVGLMTMCSLCEVHGDSSNNHDDDGLFDPLWEEILNDKDQNGWGPSGFLSYSMSFGDGSTGSTGSTGATGSNFEILAGDMASIDKTNSSSFDPLSSAIHCGSTLRSHQTLMGLIQNRDLADSTDYFNDMSEEEIGYLAQAGTDTLLPLGSTQALGRKTDQNDLWVDLYGITMKIPPNPGTNTVHNKGLGFLLGYDRFMSSGMLTGAVGYAHYKIKESRGAGDGHTDIISAIGQGTSYFPYSLFLEYSLLGSINFNQFNRNINKGQLIEVAASHFKSYTLNPHLGFGYDWKANNWLILEPFIWLDSVFDFQESYSEEGDSALAIRNESALNSGIFRLECGLHTYQQWVGKKGQLIIREKLSYVREQPEFGTSNSVFVEDLGSFNVTTALVPYDLAAFSIELFGRTNNGFFSSILYQGEMGEGVVSNDLHLRIGCFF